MVQLKEENSKDVKTEEWFEHYLFELLTEIVPAEEVQEILNIESPDNVSTYDEEGVLTTDKGLVVRFNGGKEFFLTIKGG